MAVVSISSSQMQQYPAVALTWFLTLFDRHSQFESPVTCNCTCEIDVKAVPCEIPSWGGELLKLAVTLGIGVAIGLAELPCEWS